MRLVSHFIVNHEEIAQGAMDQAETKVRTDPIGVTIVLKEGVDKGPWVEGISHVQADEMKCNRPLRELDIIH